MYSLYAADLAEQDLDRILNYMTGELANPIAARTFLDKIADCYVLLRTRPKIYVACDDSYLRGKGYRKAMIGNYLLIFRIEEKTKRIYILRFFYGAQDYLSQL